MNYIVPKREKFADDDVALKGDWTTLHYCQGWRQPRLTKCSPLVLGPL